MVWGSDGDQHTAIEIAAGQLDDDQEGQAVFRWATTKLTAIARRGDGAAGVGPADIDVFVPHQANLRIVEAIAKQARLRPDDVVVARDIVAVRQHLGGLDPAGADRAAGARRGQAPATSRCVLGFGAGLTYAGQVLVLP